MDKRMPDGTYNDLSDPAMGSAGISFGRNTHPDKIRPNSECDLLTPNPRDVSNKLMARETFKAADKLNLLAASWIQFQAHDWFNHVMKPRRDAYEKELIKIPLDPNDRWHENPMCVPRSVEDKSGRCGPHCHPSYINTETHWWDASQIYGSRKETTNNLRAFEDGKLKMTEEGLLLPHPDREKRGRFYGIELTGFDDNWWVGLSMFHTLFTAEHNAICDYLKGTYPNWTDEQLFNKARLINAAVMAKIHTVEWTPAILNRPALELGMRSNWWGLAGQRLTDMVGRIHPSEMVSGIPGSPKDHHGVPYTMTEEFVAIYRMHPLLPDELRLYCRETNEFLEPKRMLDLIGNNTRDVIERFPMTDLFYSFGLAHPGAITLQNFPETLRKFERVDGEIIDLASVDILRDRERGVPRYNDFREMVGKSRIKSFEELEKIVGDKDLVKTISDVYNGNLDMIDLQVGLMAETPPKGFAFSDTAFRIFILMASRRLKSDRFFTTDFTPEVYTPEGMAWIKGNNMKTVLLRHYPSLVPAFQGVENIFFPWNPIY
jgi:hypothetical protein